MRGLVQSRVPLRSTHDDTARVEVVIQSLALAEEFRGEDDVFRARLPADALRVPYRYRALDHHDRIRVHALDELYDLLHVARVEVVLHRVVVGRGGYHHEIGVPVGRCPVEGRHEVKVLLRKVFLDVVILDRGFPAVDQVHLFGDDVHRRYMVVLAQKGRDAQAYVAGAGYGDSYVLVVHVRWLVCRFVMQISPLAALGRNDKNIARRNRYALFIDHLQPFGADIGGGDGEHFRQLDHYPFGFSDADDLAFDAGERAGYDSDLLSGFQKRRNV